VRPGRYRCWEDIVKRGEPRAEVASVASRQHRGVVPNRTRGDTGPGPRVYYKPFRAFQLDLKCLLRIPVLPRKISKGALSELKVHSHQSQAYPPPSSTRSRKIFSRMYSSTMPLNSCPRIIPSRYTKLSTISKRITPRWSPCRCPKASRCLPVPLRTSSKGEYSICQPEVTEPEPLQIY
jgi:hypothetical protein